MNFKVNISVCRVCMKSETGKSLLKDLTLQEKFIYTTRLKIKENDNLPKIICPKCVVRMKVSFEFIQLAHTSEKHLRTFLSKISNDFQEVTKLSSSNSFLDALEDDEEIQDLIEQEGAGENITPSRRHVQKSVKSEVAAEITASTIETKQELIDNDLNDYKNVCHRDDEDEVETAVRSNTSSGNNVTVLLDAERGQEIYTVQQVEEQAGLSREEKEDVEEEEEDVSYIEEFQEIIHEDHCDSNQYIDENTTELALYEDTEVLLDQDMDITSLDSASKGTTAKTSSQPLNRPPVKSNIKKPRNVSETTAHICIVCNRDFSTKTNLMRHMISHDGRKPYQCNVCGKSFTQNGSLKQHMYIHTGEKPHVCNVCNRGFTQSKSLLFHMRRHTGEKPFKCSQCDLSFRQKDGLKHHFSKHHSEKSQEQHICWICYRSLSSKYSLQVHMQKHSNHTPAVKSENSDIDQTEVLAKDYGNSTTPDEKTAKPPQSLHMEPVTVINSNSSRSSRAKNFQCSKCFKSFAIKRNLLRHLSNHDVNKSDLFQCEECKIGFNTNRGLKLHRLREHKDKISDLNTCEYCNAPFVSIADLNNHIATVHDAINVDCPHCPTMNFRSQKLYDEHMLEHEHLLED